MPNPLSSPAWSRGLLLAGFMALAACQSSGETAPIATILTSSDRDQLTADASLERLKEGNKRFVSETPLARNWKAQMEASARGVFPYAAVLTDTDSRLPLELCFDVGVGELIQVRTPGPLLDEGAKMALANAAAKGVHTVVVLGVSDSPWAQAATTGERAPGNLRVVDALESAMGETSVEPSTWPVDGIEYSDAVIATHVKNVAASVADEVPALGEAVNRGTLKVVPAFYDIATGAVIWF